MIKKQYLFPEYYINKQPYCDDCNIPLKFTGTTLMSSPPLYVYKCEKCNKEYNINENELKGEWIWKQI